MTFAATTWKWFLFQLNFWRCTLSPWSAFQQQRAPVGPKQSGPIYTGHQPQMQANGTCCCKCECSHWTRAMSKELQICVRASSVDWAWNSKLLYFQDAPPPGSYDVVSAYTKTQLKREPGAPRSDSGKRRRGAFLTSQTRNMHFGPHDSNIPGQQSGVFVTFRNNLLFDSPQFSAPPPPKQKTNKQKKFKNTARGGNPLQEVSFWTDGAICNWDTAGKERSWAGAFRDRCQPRAWGLRCCVLVMLWRMVCDALWGWYNLHCMRLVVPRGRSVNEGLWYKQACSL